MAELGAQVLVVEQETGFRDRVRGEGMHFLEVGVPPAAASAAERVPAQRTQPLSFQVR